MESIDANSELKVWIDARQKEIEKSADNNEISRWENLSKGLKTHQRTQYINKRWQSLRWKKEHLIYAIIACKRLNIPYEVTTEGVIARETKENLKKHEEQIFEQLRVLEKELRILAQVTSNLNSITRGIPYNEGEKLFDVVVILDSYEYRNSEIRELLKTKEAEQKNKKQEQSIVVAQHTIIEQGYEK